MLKKAQETSVGTPVYLVILIAAIAVIAIVIFTVALPKMKKLSDRDICRNSFIIRSHTKPGGTESVWPLNCHTNFINVEKDGIYIKRYGIDEDKSRDVSFKRGEKLSEKEDKIKRYIANQMYDCWYQSNKGQSDPWGDWHLGTRTHCMICADISFDSELSEDIGKIDDFVDFLNKEEVHKVLGVSYSDYFGEKLEIEEDFYIDTSKQYLVLYKLDDLGAGHVVLLGTGGGCGAGALLAWLGPPGMAAGTVGGCVIGFAASVYTSRRDSQKKSDLQAKILLVEAEAVEPGFCHRIG